LSGLDDVLRILAERRDALANSEALSTERLDSVRRMVEANQRTYEALTLGLGLSDGVRRVVAADAVLLAAAEADFDANVKAREAIDAVMAELRALED